MKKNRLVSAFSLFSAVALAIVLYAAPASAIEGVYVGGQVGEVGLTGNASHFGNAIGFGFDLGVRTNAIVDVLYSLGISSHTGMSLYSNTLSAQIHWLEVEDFDFTVAAGPGFYFFKMPNQTETDFGLNFGTAVDLKVDDGIRLGLGFRYHVVLNPTFGDNYWSVMMRAGYFFEM